MRPTHTAELDTTRVTVAPIITNARGLSTEVPVGAGNGLDTECVVSCDNAVTVPASALGRRIGSLLPAQEPELTEAIHAGVRPGLTGSLLE